MSVAVLNDIHGNLPALEAVLAELRADPPDAVVVGGDVAAGPQPVEVLEALRALPWPVHWLRGNADRAGSDEERVTVFAPPERLARILGGERLVVGGHTHRQFDLRAGAGRFVNAGSVGRPYEHGPGAYWLRLDPEVRLMRTEYDTAAATATFRALGYPARRQHAGAGRRRRDRAPL